MLHSMVRACLRQHPVLILTFLLLLTGCTIGAAPNTPTLATTTSAEQTQRIFWQDVKDRKWLVVASLLTANVTWRDVTRHNTTGQNGGTILTREQIVPYLQQLQIKDFLITNLVVKADANDMTVLYDLQLTLANAAQPVNLNAVAVWQQRPVPPDNAPKKEKKKSHESAPYLLTVEDLAPGPSGQ